MSNQVILSAVPDIYEYTYERYAAQLIFCYPWSEEEVQVQQEEEEGGAGQLVKGGVTVVIVTGQDTTQHLLTLHSQSSDFSYYLHNYFLIIFLKSYQNQLLQFKIHICRIYCI